MKKPAPTQPAQAEPEDAALFRAAVGAVTPLPDRNRVVPPTPRRKPPSRRPAPAPELPDTLSDAPSDDTTGDTPGAYLANGLARLTLRKLRRGAWPVGDTLDLHGCKSDAARKLLQEFLHEAMQRNLRSVLIIHGKGINSAGGEAVLRRLTRHWLTQLPQVLAWCDAPPADGGSGAVMVLLKAGR